jgi:hypothetical protein
MQEYPEFCIRGIRKLKEINQDDTVALNVYLPYTKTSETRTDNGSETSINWEDKEEVLNFTLNFRDEKNQLVFANGAVKLAKDEIDHINTLPSTQDTLLYERDELDENPYHGNIVFRAELSNPKRNMIASILAAASSKVFKRS